MNVFLFKIKANSHEYAFRLFQRQIFLLIMKKIIKILKWLYEKSKIVNGCCMRSTKKNPIINMLAKSSSLAVFFLLKASQVTVFFSCHDR